MCFVTGDGRSATIIGSNYRHDVSCPVAPYRCDEPIFIDVRLRDIRVVFLLSSSSLRPFSVVCWRMTACLCDLHPLPIPFFVPLSTHTTPPALYFTVVITSQYQQRQQEEQQQQQQPRRDAAADLLSMLHRQDQQRQQPPDQVDQQQQEVMQRRIQQQRLLLQQQQLLHAEQQQQREQQLAAELRSREQQLLDLSEQQVRL